MSTEGVYVAVEYVEIAVVYPYTVYLTYLLDGVAVVVEYVERAVVYPVNCIPDISTRGCCC